MRYAEARRRLSLVNLPAKIMRAGGFRLAYRQHRLGFDDGLSFMRNMWRTWPNEKAILINVLFMFQFDLTAVGACTKNKKRTTSEAETNFGLVPFKLFGCVAYGSSA